VNSDEIVRTDFPASRKGYDRDAVDAHLRRLAAMVDEIKRGGEAARSSLASSAGEQVTEILAAAEAKAEELEAEARRQAERIVSDAKAEARAQVELAQGAVAGLVKQADELRERVGALGRDLAATPSAETDPGPATVPEPTVPQPEVDPSPVVVPEPEPLPEPDPMPEREPDIAPPPQPDQPPPAAAGTANGDEAAARLVAMKMALDGSSREDVERHLDESFGLSDASALLDDVFERAGR